MKIILSLIIAMALISSCKKNEKVKEIMPMKPTIGNEAKPLTIKEHTPNLKVDKSHVKVINVPEKTSINYVDEYISSCKYILLETREDCLIGNIDKLYNDANYIFIFDRKNASVFTFTDKGKFVSKIGKKGRGPEEYSEIENMSIDKTKQEICLLDLGGRKLLFYTYTGKFLREENMYYTFDEIEFFKNKRILNLGLLAPLNKNIIPECNCHDILITDKNHTPLFKGVPFPEELERNGFYCDLSRSLYSFEDKKYYVNVLSDTIWQIKENSISAEYVVKFKDGIGNHDFTPEELKTLTNEVYHAKTKDKNHFFGQFLITKDFIYFNLMGHLFCDPLVVCRSTGHLVYGGYYPRMEGNPLSQMLISNSFDFTYNDSSFVKVRQSYRTLNLIKENLSKASKDYYKISDYEKDFIKNIDPEGNPILMIINFKKF